MKIYFVLRPSNFNVIIALRPSKVRKLVRTNQFQVKSTKMGTGRKFVTLQYVVDVLPNACVPSLKTCASFVVAHQFTDNLDKLFGVVPSTLIANLKGRWALCWTVRTQGDRRRASLTLSSPMSLGFRPWPLLGRHSDERSRLSSSS